MLRKFLTTTAAAAIAVSGVSVATITTLALSTEMAVAGNGSGSGNGNNGNSRSNSDNGGSRTNNSGGNGNGKIASTLGALNAAHVSQNALDNAAPNSRVGMIATYQREAILTIALTDEATAAADALKALELTALVRTSTIIQGEIDAAVAAGLVTTALDAELIEAMAFEAVYDADHLAAEALKTSTAAAAAAQETTEADALEAAANKDVPTGAALDALRVMLGLN